MMKKNLLTCLIAFFAILSFGCGDPNAEFEPDTKPKAAPAKRDGTSHLPSKDEPVNNEAAESELLGN